MMILEERGNGRVAIDCQRCGRMYEIPDFRGNAFLTAGYESSRRCPECAAAEEAERLRQKKLEEKRAAEARRAELLKNSELPPHYWQHKVTLAPLCDAPALPKAFRWLWDHRRENILLSGETGSGKSTAACAAAYRMIRDDGKRIRYAPLRRLLTDWRAAKTDDDGDAPERFLRTLRQLDVLIVDEVVGKAHVTDSGQELLFELLESVNSGTCRAKIWLLGNFYAGSIEEIFSDPEPVRRRLAENFCCALLQGGEARPLEVWHGKS